MKELNKSYKDPQFTYVDNVFLLKYSKNTLRQTINDHVLYKNQNSKEIKKKSLFVQRINTSAFRDKNYAASVIHANKQFE